MTLPVLSRRRLLKAIALLSATTMPFSTAMARVRAITAVSSGSSFNGGKFQTNPNFTQIGADYCFANYILDSIGWSCRDNSGPVTPDQLTATGYPLPTSDCMVNHLGCIRIFFIPSIVNGGNIYAVPVTGKGTVETFGSVATIPIVSITGGSTTATINFGATHYFQAGMECPLSGVSGTIASALNGNKFVVASTTSTTATITVSGTNGQSGTGGTAAYGDLNVGVATGGMVIMDVTGVSPNGPGPSSGNAIQINFSIRATDATTPISSIAYVPIADLARWKADPLAFGSKFLQVLTTRKPGVIRFLNKTDTNDSNVAFWSDRKPTNYLSFADQQMVPALWSGTTTSTLNSYAISNAGFTGADKQKVTLAYDSAAVTVSVSGSAAVVTFPSAHNLTVGKPFNLFFNFGGAAPTDASTGLALAITGAGIATGTPNATDFYVLTVPTANTLTFSFTRGGTPVTTSASGSSVRAHASLSQNDFVSTNGSAVLTCTNHSFSVGDLIAPPPFQNGSSYPTGVSPYGHTYFVVASTSTTIQISATSGGTAITMDKAQTITFRQEAVLSVNGGTALPIKDRGATVPSMGANNIFYSRTSGSNNSFATVVFDAELNCYLNYGSSVAGGACGIRNAWPPEVCVKLCKEVGSHPYFTSPPYALDAPTDYIPGLAAYCKSYAAANATWMIPRYEGINEDWNGGFFGTLWTFAKAEAHSGWTSTSFYEEYGLQVSCMGQAVNTAYGGAVGTGYELLCGFQTSSGIGSASGNAPRMDAGQYVNHGPTFAGYSKTPAYNWVTVGVCAQYFGSNATNTSQETTWANAMAKFTGSINTSGVLNVSATQANAVAVGMQISGGGVPWQSIVTANLGGGNWQLSVSPTAAVASQQMYGVDPATVALYVDGTAGARVIGSVSGSTLTVTSVVDAWMPVIPNDGRALSGGAVLSNTLVQGQLSGTPGGAGTYQLSVGGQSVPGGTTIYIGSFTPAANGYVYKNFASFLAGYTNNAGNHPRLQGYEGGSSNDMTAQGATMVDQFRAFAKLCTSSPLKTNGLQDYYTDNVDNFTAAGGLFWSEFNTTGAMSVVDAWSASDDLYMTPYSPQMAAVAARN